MRSKDLCVSAVTVLLAVPLAISALSTDEATNSGLGSASAGVSGSGSSSGSAAAIGIAVCPPLIHSLAVGSRGNDVIELQQFLRSGGYLEASSTGYFGLLTKKALGAWQVENGIVSAQSAGWGFFGPVSRSYYTRLCRPSDGPTNQSPISSSQRVNAPGSVTLRQGGIAEIRNKSYYFTLTDLTATSATLQVTPVGCWNSFPSDTPPQVVCMLAVMPIAPITLAIGQTDAVRAITLTQINGASATFSIGDPSNQ